MDQINIIEYLEEIIIAMWRKKCAKLSEDGKLTVKKDVHLVVYSSNFSRPLSQVYR